MGWYAIETKGINFFKLCKTINMGIGLAYLFNDMSIFNGLFDA